MHLVILATLLLVVGAGYGQPAPPIAATARPAPGGHVITWEVSNDADGWRILAGETEVYRAPWYLHPGTTDDVFIGADLWQPGEALTICDRYAPDEEEPDASLPVEHCQAVAPRLVLWLPQVHR